MTKLEREISKLLKKIDPLIIKTHESEIIFHESWNREYPTQGEKYKKSQLYLSTLESTKQNLLKIQSIIKPVIVDLKNNPDKSITTALAYITTTNRHFGSGYNKETIYKLLKKISLNSEQIDYLQKLFIKQIGTEGREFGEFLKLYPKIRDDEFDKKIIDLVKTINSIAQKRIQSIISN